MNRPRSDNDDCLFCGACGTQIEATARFCTSCGESQAQFIEPTAPPHGHGEDVGDPYGAAPTEVMSESVSPAALAERQTKIAGVNLDDLGSGSGRGPKEQQVTGIVIAGYICAVLLPVAGAVIGATQLNRNRHGIWIVGISIAMVVLGILLSILLVVWINSSVPDYTEY